MDNPKDVVVKPHTPQIVTFVEVSPHQLFVHGNNLYVHVWTNSKCGQAKSVESGKEFTFTLETQVFPVKRIEVYV